MKVIAPVDNIGLDAKIYQIQKRLGEYLQDIWRGDITIYGRLFENTKDDKKILEAFISGNDYKQPFIDDKLSCTIGFKEISRLIAPTLLTARLDVIVTGNINKLIGQATRNDEKVFLQIYTGLKKTMAIDGINGTKRGIDNVFSGYNTENIKYRDMQPWFCFSFEIEVQYNENIAKTTAR